MKQLTITPHVATSYEVGAILYDSWGYEQTNIDYYCIIERKGDWLTLLPMKADSASEGPLSMCTIETPLIIDDSNKPIRKKLKIFDGKESGFSFRNYCGGGWCKLWDGKSKIASHYA
jgi:hypothetical protein